MTWTILHPGYFMESWLGPMLFADPVAGTARFYGSAETRARYVSVGDVAEVTVLCLDNPAAKNQVIKFGGPEELSQAEALARFEKAFGKPFNVTTIPAEALEAQWKSAPDPLSRSFSALMLAMSRRSIAAPALPKEFPVTMKTVDEYIREIRSGR